MVGGMLIGCWNGRCGGDGNPDFIGITIPSSSSACWSSANGQGNMLEWVRNGVGGAIPAIVPLSTLRRYGSKLMVNGRKIRRSATSKSCLCKCKNASSLRSSRSRSSNGAASRRHVSLMRALQGQTKKAKIYEKNLLIWSLNKKRLTVRRATATTCYHRFDRPSDRAAAQSCWPSAATVRSNWSRSSNDTNWSRFGMLSTDALQGNGTHH